MRTPAGGVFLRVGLPRLLAWVDLCTTGAVTMALLGSVVLLLAGKFVGARGVLALAMIPFPVYLLQGALLVQVLVVLRSELWLTPIWRARALHRASLGFAWWLALVGTTDRTSIEMTELFVAIAAVVSTKFLIPLMAFRSVGDWRIKHFEEKYNYTDSEREFLRDRVLKLYCREWGFVIKPPNPEPASADTASQESRHP